MPKKKVMPMPTFLQHVSVNMSDKSRLEGVLSNWLRTHPHITKLEATPAALRELEQLMVLEYARTPAPRPHMIERLYGKYSKLRQEVERAQLEATA